MIVHSNFGIYFSENILRLTIFFLNKASFVNSSNKTRSVKQIRSLVCDDWKSISYLAFEHRNHVYWLVLSIFEAVDLPSGQCLHLFQEEKYQLFIEKKK